MSSKQLKTNSDCGFTSRLRSKSVSIMRWQGSWNSFHLQQKMQMVSTLRCTSIHTLRDLTRELTWTSREPLRYFFSPFDVFYCMTTETVFLRTLSNPIRTSTENSWWQSTSWKKHWHWRGQMLIIICTMYRMQFYQNLYLQVFCARSSGLLYIGKEKGGVCSEKEGLLSKGPRKVIVSCAFLNSLLCSVLNNTSVRKVAPLSLKSLLRKKHLIR